MVVTSRSPFRRPGKYGETNERSFQYRPGPGAWARSSSFWDATVTRSGRGGAARCGSPARRGRRGEPADDRRYLPAAFTERHAAVRTRPRSTCWKSSASASPFRKSLEVALPKRAPGSTWGPALFPRALVGDVIARPAGHYVAYGVTPGARSSSSAAGGEFLDRRRGYQGAGFQQRRVSPLDPARSLRFRTAGGPAGTCIASQTVVATDMPDRLTADYNVAYAILSATQKPSASRSKTSSITRS